MKKAIKAPALKNVRQHGRHSPVVVEPPDVDVPAAFLVLELSEVLRNDDMVYNKDKDTYKVSPKNAAGAIVHRLNHQWLAPLRHGKCFFGLFLLRLEAGSSAPKSCRGKIYPHSTQFWL